MLLSYTRHLPYLIAFAALLLTFNRVQGLSQEIRLAPQFCQGKDPPAMFDTSITSLADLYEYLVPQGDTDETLDTTTSQVSHI